MKKRVVVNGKSVRTPAVLKKGDITQVGGARFMFMPLCGESFDWRRDENAS